MMPHERKISGARIVRDIRAGMTAVELMKQHKLSRTQLKSILGQLERAGMHVPELYGRSVLEHDSMSEDGIRRWPRYNVIPYVPVHDVKDPMIKGRLVDISEKGLGVAGISAAAQEVRKLIVLADQFFAIEPFQVQVVCRWCRKTGDERRWLSGFEIASVTERSFQRLRSLIDALTRAELATTTVEFSAFSEIPEVEEVQESAWVCPFCKMPQPREYDECPQCGIIVSKYIHQLHRTKTEVVNIIEEQSRLPDTSTVAKEKLVRKNIMVSEKTWNDLKALGGDVDNHIADALSSYLAGVKRKKSQRQHSIS